MTWYERDVRTGVPQEEWLRYPDEERSIEKIRARLEAISGDEWWARGEQLEDGLARFVYAVGDGDSLILFWRDGCSSDADEDFIVNAKADIAFLLDRLNG